MLDWHHPELERLIEVHSSWGTGGWFLRDALARGLRLGDEVGSGTGAANGAGDLVRVSWGDARHRDRYRWATWSGTVDVGGVELLGAEPWAFLHPEQELSVDGSRLRWSARTFGGDVGADQRLGRGDPELSIEAWVAEDDRVERFTVGPEELDAGPVRRDLGGAGLHVTVERVAATADLPLTLAGELTIDPPPGDSAVYLHARQSDGHEVWTSPLFFHR